MAETRENVAVAEELLQPADTTQPAATPEGSIRMELRNLSVGYGNRVVLSGFNADVVTGRVLCLLGPNGVGKTTLFKSVLGLQPVLGGSVTIGGRDALAMNRREFARRVAYVPQAHQAPFAFYVRDVVAVGRVSHVGFFSKPHDNDYAIVEEVLEELGIADLADRVYTELSGGERQMVLIARALAQKPRFLFMDEPTSNLDFGNQVAVVQLAKKLAHENGLGVVMTTHNPNHLLMCEGDGVLILPGSRYRYGTADEILTDENLHDAYGIHVEMLDVDSSAGYTKTCCPVLE